jgi:hypothetical protein
MTRQKVDLELHTTLPAAFGGSADQPFGAPEGAVG